MKIEEIDAISYKNNKPKEVKENVVQDETITLTINNDISRSLSAIEDSLKEFAVGYMFNENMVDSMDAIKDIKIEGSQIYAEIDDTLLKTNETVLCSDSAGGWRSKIKTVKKVESDFQVSVHELIDRIEELKDNAEIFTEKKFFLFPKNCFGGQFIIILSK